MTVIQCGYTNVNQFQNRDPNKIIKFNFNWNIPYLSLSVANDYELRVYK